MATCFDRKTVIILLYLKNVLYWPDDDRLTVETCCHNVMSVHTNKYHCTYI